MDPTSLKGFQVSTHVGHSEPLPKWWGQLWDFAKSIASEDISSPNKQRLFVLSVPQMHGALSAVSLGLLDGVLARLLASAAPKEINLEDIQPGMLVQIDSGQSGSEVFYGEVGNVDTSSSNTKIQVGSKLLSARFIRRVQLLSPELGKPQGHYSKDDEFEGASSEMFHSFDPVRHTKAPILRPFLVLRTVPEHSLELEWVVYDPISDLTSSVNELLHGMQKGDKQSVATLVANTKQSLLSKMEALKVDSKGLINSEEVTCLVGTKAILENLEQTDSNIAVCILARDEDSLENVQALIAQIYAYGEKVDWNTELHELPESLELLVFDRSKL